MATEDEVPCCARSSCCCCCVSHAINVIISLIFFICVASFLVWAMLASKSNAVKFQVHEAELTRFDLQNNNNLHYNLSLIFSIRNSNSHMGIHYDKFEADLSYSDQRLASVSVPSFYQGHKSTAVVETVFEGQDLVLLGEYGMRKFVDDKKLEVYGIDVKVRIRSRVLFLHLVTWPMKPIIRCHLKVPLGSSNSSGGFDFQPTKCHLAF